MSLGMFGGKMESHRTKKAAWTIPLRFQVQDWVVGASQRIFLRYIVNASQKNLGTRYWAIQSEVSELIFFENFYGVVDNSKFEENYQNFFDLSLLI